MHKNEVSSTVPSLLFLSLVSTPYLTLFLPLTVSLEYEGTTKIASEGLKSKVYFQT